MAKLVHSNLETNEENNDGFTLTLYFEGTPTDEEVRAVCESLRGKHNGCVDVEDEFFGWKEYPNPVADKAKLVRVQVFPFG